MASFSLPGLCSGSVLTFSADPSPVHAGGSGACHYPAWSFYLPVVVPPPQGGWQREAGVVGRERASAPPASCDACSEEEHAFFKAQP